MDAFEPKLIYLTRRHPSLDRGAFIRRWREHARLGMSLPRWRNIARYVHCDLEAPLPGERFADGYDGIGLIWHRSAEHRRAHLADTTSRSAMETDEAQTFAAPIADICLVAREDVVRTPDPSAQWKLIRFAATSEPSPEPANCRGLVRNHSLPPENRHRWGLDCTLIEEFWFDSRDAASAAAADLSNDAIVVLGRDTLLYP